MKRAHRRAAKLARLARINDTHCSAQPICGRDLHRAVDVLDPRNETSTARVPGYVQCANVHTCNSGDMNVFWRQTRALRRLVHTPGQYLEELTEILNRLVTFKTKFTGVSVILMRPLHGIGVFVLCQCPDHV